jgi:two-component system chemotaxis sensor kinase CheA
LTELTKLREGLAQLTRNTRELQETVLKMRMLPVSNLFERFPRVVHDVSRQLNKSVALEISGETTELDRTVLEKLSDPLVHLVRNSLDHGIERSEVREKAGKPAQGTLHLHAEHKGGNVLIEISDDGGGLDTDRILARAQERGLVKTTDVLTEAEIHELIFEPGFSTAQALSEISGRGVGLDVVRRNVQEVGGRVDITSRFGLGTVTTIQLPLTLAILDGQLMRVGDQRFVVPLVSIIESVQAGKADLHSIADQVEIYHWRDEYLRVVRLHEFFQVAGSSEAAEKSLMIIVESRGDRIAMSVDDLLAQQQVVIKSLETNFQKVDGIAGATILGDGAVAMILDVAEIIEKSKCAVGVLQR